MKKWRDCFVGRNALLAMTVFVFMHIISSKPLCTSGGFSAQEQINGYERPCQALLHIRTTHAALRLDIFSLPCLGEGGEDISGSPSASYETLKLIQGDK
jgi:hypothetical protein